MPSSQDVSVNSQDLYGLPLERFTPERNALAKQLRERGDRDEAARVAKLKKPSVAAWAVNQLVRTQKREVEAVFRAGDELQKAQANVLEGRGEPGSLRKAADAERAGLERLTRKARGLLSGEGHELSPAKLEQVSDTLHAAAIDEDARDQVRDGCLVRELRHVGLGALGAPAATAGRRPAAKQRRPGDDAAKLRSARRAEGEARRQRDRAVRSAREAEERRSRAAANLEEAEEALATAQELARDATALHEQAIRALDELRP